MLRQVKFRAQINQVREVHHAHLQAHDAQVFLPRRVIERIAHHARQALVVAEPIPAQHLKLKNEQPRLGRLAGQIVGLAFENEQRGIDTETDTFLFRLADDKGLVGRKIVRQLAEARGE